MVKLVFEVPIDIVCPKLPENIGFSPGEESQFEKNVLKLFPKRQLFPKQCSLSSNSV